VKASIIVAILNAVAHPLLLYFLRHIKCSKICLYLRFVSCFLFRTNFFISFLAEVLPLVEFTLEEGITDEEATRLVGSGMRKSHAQGDNWENHGNTQSMRITQEDEDDDDPFTARLLTFEVFIYTVPFCCCYDKNSLRLG